MQDNLKIFSNFFNYNYHLIIRGTNNWPSERIIFQLGYEHSENSIITHQAEEFLKNKRVKWPWLKQINRAKGNQISPNYSTIQKFDFNWHSYVLLDQDTLVGVSYWSLCICDVKTGVCKPFNEKDKLENNSTAYYDENGNAVSFSGVLKINKFQFLSWHDNGSICLWNNEKKSKIIFKEDSAPITSVKLINEAQFISCSDHDIRIWNIKTQECEVLQGHNDEIYDLIIIDNDRFLSYSKDTTFRIWDVNNNSLLFDQIKIYCDEISSTKEFQQQLKEENKRALEFSSKYNPTYEFKAREKKDQDGIESLLWLGNEKIILSSGFRDFYLFDITAKSFKPIFGSTLLEWYFSLETKKYDLEDRIFDLEIGDIPSLPPPPGASVEEDELFSSNDTAPDDVSDKEISNLRLKIEAIENDIERWRFLCLNAPAELRDILLIESNILGIVARDGGSQKAKFIIIDIENNTIENSVDLNMVDVNSDQVKYLGNNIILIIHKDKHFFTMMNLQTGTSTVMDQHTDKIGEWCNHDGIRILTDTNFITSSKSELRLWDISQFEIEPNTNVEMKVNYDSTASSNLLLLNNNSLIFWGYDYKNNISIYDFLNNSLIKEIEIDIEILFLETIIFSYALSKNDIIMIQEDIHGGKLYYINLLNGEINVLSDDGEVIINCIKDEYLKNHFITWSNLGVIKVWDMNTQDCIKHYVFEGVHHVSKINKNQFLVISRNGKHKVL